MNWNKEKTDKHKKAARLLGKIKDQVLQFLKANPKTSELEVQGFILDKFKQHNLINEVEKPIVAFRQNTSHVHYYPEANTNKTLQPGSLILIDIWARLDEKNAPYSDLTWMAYKQNQNAKIKMRNSSLEFKIIEIIFKTRDKCLKFLEKELKNGRMPTGQQVDAVARKFLASTLFTVCELSNYRMLNIHKFFPHGTGHELGFDSPHGKGGAISPKNTNELKIGMGYTIEPGVYFKNLPLLRRAATNKKMKVQTRGPGGFGVRTEIDFYINKNKKIVITTDLQKKISIV